MGVKPECVLEYSLGEYATLNIDGVVSASDKIYLCGRRASLIESGCSPDTHGKVAVKVSEAYLTQVTSDMTEAEIACINGPEDTVLSGQNAAINAVCQRFASLGIRFTKLMAPFAFHSSQVETIPDELEDMAHQAPALPIVSLLLSVVVKVGGFIYRDISDRNNLRGNVVSPLISSVPFKQLNKTTPSNLAVCESRLALTPS